MAAPGAESPREGSRSCPPVTHYKLLGSERQGPCSAFPGPPVLWLDGSNISKQRKELAALNLSAGRLQGPAALPGAMPGRALHSRSHSEDLELGSPCVRVSIPTRRFCCKFCPPSRASWTTVVPSLEWTFWDCSKNILEE